MNTIAALVSPVARYILVGVAVLGFISWQRHEAAENARRIAEVKCVEDAQAAAAAERDRLERAIQETLAEAERFRIRSAQEIAQLRERANGLLEQIRESGNACPIPDDVLRRLRDIE